MSRTRYSIIVVQPCCFVNAQSFCDTTERRISVALAKIGARPTISHEILLTGDVCWDPGRRPTLQELMSYRFLSAGIEKTFHIYGGTGTFSEPQLIAERVRALTTLRLFEDYQDLWVITSDWQLWAARPYWEQAFKGLLRPRFIVVRGTGGWRTRTMYYAYGLLIRAAMLTGLAPQLEKLLTKYVYQPRYDRGFRMRGCA